LIANENHAITEGFAILLKGECHEWKFQLEMLVGIFELHRLFDEHAFTSGELHFNMDCAIGARSLQYSWLLITTVRCSAGREAST
jgi:hypothetical protein